MALKKLQQVAPEQYIAEERLWLDLAGEKLHPEGHEEAVILFCVPGSLISAEDAEKFGLIPKPKAKKGAK